MHSDADTPSDQRLSHRGQGMVYSIAPGQVDAYIHYTLEADKTVNFYTIDPLETKYLGSASWATIVNYANQHGAANDIHQLGAVAILNH